MVRTIYNPFHMEEREINHLLSDIYHGSGAKKFPHIGSFYWKLVGLEKRISDSSMVSEHHDQIFRSRDGNSWELVVEQVS